MNLTSARNYFLQFQMISDEILGVHERVNFNCWPSPLCVIVHLCVTWTPNNNEKKSQTTHLCIEKYLIFHQSVNSPSKMDSYKANWKISLN